MDTQETEPAKGLRKQEHDNVSWIDIENPSNDEFALLEHEYHLHPVHLGESVQKIQHTQIEREENYLFLVLHVPVYDPQTDKIRTNQIGVFLGKDFLITIRTGISPAVTDLFGFCERQPHKKEDFFKKGSAYLLYILVSKLLDDISYMTDSVVGELDEIEDLVFDNNGSDAQRIGKVRQKIVRLSRIIGSKKLVLRDLAEQIDPFSEQHMTKYYSNNTKTVNRLWEEIEEAKETVEIYKDADFTTSTEQTNVILAVLTLLFTFTIPITIVGTLYGMNVPIPGSIVSGPWTFLGPYTTFEIVLALSVASAVAMFLYFKNKKWF